MSKACWELSTRITWGKWAFWAKAWRHGKIRLGNGIECITSVEGSRLILSARGWLRNIDRILFAFDQWHEQTSQEKSKKLDLSLSVANCWACLLIRIFPQCKSRCSNWQASSATASVKAHYTHKNRLQCKLCSCLSCFQQLATLKAGSQNSFPFYQKLFAMPEVIIGQEGVFHRDAQILNQCRLLMFHLSIGEILAS